MDMKIVPFIFSLVVVVTSYYSAQYVEDRCKGNDTVIYNLDPTKASTSTGYLRASHFAPYTPNRNCTVILQPPPGYGVVLSIRKVDFINTYGCVDYLQIYDPMTNAPTIFCRFIFDLRENRSFYSENGPLRFLYHSEGRSYGMFAEKGFETVTTTFSRDPEVCSDSEMFRCDNGRCIWKSFTCDMHNNCGDNSDESVLTCDTYLYVHDFAATYIVYISIGILFFMFSFSMTVFCFARRRRTPFRNNIHQRTSMDFPVPATSISSPYQAVYPSGFCFSQNPAGPNPFPPQYTTVNSSDGGFSNPCYPSGVPQPENPPPAYKP